MTKDFSVFSAQFSEKSPHGALWFCLELATGPENQEVLLLLRTENY